MGDIPWGVKYLGRPMGEIPWGPHGTSHGVANTSWGTSHRVFDTPWDIPLVHGIPQKQVPYGIIHTAWNFP